MSLAALPLIEIGQPLPAQTIVNPEWIDAQLVCALEKQQARQLSHRTLNAARRKAKKIVRDGQRIMRERQKKMEEENQTWRQTLLMQMEAGWLEKHVKRLGEDEVAYHHLLGLVIDRVQKSIEQVLVAWFDQQPIDQTLCHRLAQQAQSMASEGALQLRIHPHQQTLIRETFGNRFTLILDSSFAQDRAELSSARCAVEFSLSDHFRQLLEWLSQTEISGETNGTRNP